MSLISLDLFVAPTRSTETAASPGSLLHKPETLEPGGLDMWEFGRFLRFNGWRL